MAGLTPDSSPEMVLQIDESIPSDLKFGFLGLGKMGRGIVKNLLNSGHSVIIWNRTPDKYEDFVKVAGAIQAQTPSDVIQEADITFSCLSGPSATKELIFDTFGFLNTINSRKGYVEMTQIDAETSKEIAEAICGQGGRYLEAQIHGSIVEAQEGSLVILAAGDCTLFDECSSCFDAIGRKTCYLGEVGTASKMNLILKLMFGVTQVAVAEGLALANKAGLEQHHVLEILERTSLACPLILEKGQAIINKFFHAQVPLQHIQEDLKLVLDLGDQLEQHLPLTASSNQQFINAKRLGYAEHDMSSVYMPIGF